MIDKSIRIFLIFFKIGSNNLNVFEMLEGLLVIILRKHFLKLLFFSNWNYEEIKIMIFNLNL